MSKQVFGGAVVFQGAVIPISTAVRAGDFVFISGQLPIRDGKLVTSDIRDQVGAALDNVANALDAADCSLADIVKINAFLSDASDFPPFNEIYRTRFPLAPPARTTVVVALTFGARIEIDAIAYRPLRA